MAVIFSESRVAGVPAGKGATRKYLLTETRLPGTGILLDRLTLGPRGEARLTVPATSVAWLQVLGGELLLTQGCNRQTLSDAHIAFLPPGFCADVKSERGTALLYGKIPHASRFDPSFTQSPRRSGSPTGRASRCSIPSMTRASASIW